MTAAPNWVNLHAPARSAAGLTAAAATIGCDVPTIKAICDVEAGSGGFDRYGRLKALFEPHIFYRLCAGKSAETLRQGLAAGLAYPKQGEEPYPTDSWPRIKAAWTIDPELACQAASWGLPQILGVNYKEAGYDSAVALVANFLGSEDEQIAAMARLIAHNPELRKATISHDWATFARIYNGPLYAKFGYDREIETAYLKELAAPSAKKTPVGKIIVAGAGAAAAGGAATTAAINNLPADPVAMALALGLAAVAIAASIIVAILHRGQSAPLVESAADHIPTPISTEPTMASQPIAPQPIAHVTDGITIDSLVAILKTKRAVVAAAQADLEAHLGLLLAARARISDALDEPKGTNS